MSNHPELNAHEARLLGVLIEKELTTPEGYPLSLNAATSGANQKSNRDPVTDFTEAEIHVGLHGLVMKHLAGRVVPAGSRVEKYRHTARERLELDDTKLALLAELLMRGPQTQGELRTRASRMVDLPSLEFLVSHLNLLQQRGFVRRIDPSPGSRAERYVQVLARDLHPLDAPAAAVDDSPREARVDRRDAPREAPGPRADFEARLASLEADMARIKAAMKDLGAL